MMGGQRSHVGTRSVVMAAAAITTWHCGSSLLTASRVETSIAGTFSNLVQAQLLRIGLASVAPVEIKVKATCHRPGGGDSGAGEWICSLVWSGPNGSFLQDTFDVTVGPDGCYTAAVDPTESQLGGPTSKALDGRTERNLLYKFDGCFDPT